MNWDIITVIIGFLSELYHAGGAKTRWVVWVWCAFIFLYVLLGKYDSIHRKDIIINRKMEQRNYFYALHVFGILTAVIEYGNFLDLWSIYIPILRSKTLNIGSVLGFTILIIGFFFVLSGRLYLNSYWGKDIYKYDDKQEYTLVTEKIYRICRHPIYFGQVCMCIGTALVQNNWIILFLSILMVCMNVIRAKREDHYLAKCFGEKWEEYHKKVSFFVPFF